MDRDLRIRVILSKVGDLVAPLAAIGKQSKVTSDSLRGTQSELKRLKAVQADVAGFRQLKAGLAGTQTEMTKAQARVNGLAKQIGAASAPTKKLTADFANAKKYAAALKTQHGEQSAALQKLRDKLSTAGVSTAKLAEHERTLRGDLAKTTDQLQAQKKALGDIAKAERRTGAAKRQLGQTRARASNIAIGGAATLGAGMAMLAPLRQAFGAASEFEAQLTNIAQKTDLTRAEATKLGGVLSTLAPRVNQLPSALAEGADILAGFGLTAKAIPDLMLPIGRAATAYQAEISDLAKASFAVNDNLKVPFEQTGQALDIMAEAGKRGAFELKDMAQFFPALTASAQGLGQKGAPAVADLAAALQIVRKGAGDSSSAANNLQNVLTKITAPSTIKKFEKLGVDLPAALKRAYADGKTPIEAISELVNKTLHGDMSKLGTLFEDMQVQQALRPLIANLAEYRQIRSASLAATGTVERDFAERLQDAGQASQRLGVASQALQIKLGTILLPALVTITEKLNVVLDKVTAWTDAHPQLTKVIAITAVIIGVLLVLVGGLAIAFAGILGPFALLRFAFIAILPFASALATAILGITFPVWATIAAIAGLIAIGYAIYKHWDQLAAWFSEIGAAIMDGLINGISKRWAAVKAYVSDIANKVAAAFRNALGIKSPSRVFASYGGHLMAGLANGINGGASAPLARINKVSRDMTAALAVGAMAASPAAAAAGGNAGGGAPASAARGGTVIEAGAIVINQLPGQSSQELARAVAAEIARIESGKAAARRSSLADYGD